jgi:hypothetical protein
VPASPSRTIAVPDTDIGMCGKTACTLLNANAHIYTSIHTRTSQLYFIAVLRCPIRISACAVRRFKLMHAYTHVLNFCIPLTYCGARHGYRHVRQDCVFSRFIARVRCDVAGA